MNFEVSEKSMNIYKKYAEESINNNSNIISKLKYPINKSYSNQTLQSVISSYSIISTPQFNNDIKNNQKNLSNKFDLDRFFSNPNDLNCDPLKKLEEKNLSIYLSFLNVGLRGANEPSEASFKCYESYLSKRKLINVEF
jgi:hypothetical protein